MTKTNNKLNGALAIIAAFLVLFAAMWRAEAVLVVSVSCLILLAAYFLIWAK